MDETRPDESIAPRLLGLDWPETQRAPEPKVVAGLHRGADGYIALARRDESGQFVELGAVAVDQPFLPELMDELTANAFLAVNTCFGLKARLRKVEEWVPSIELPRGHEFADVYKDFPGAQVLVERLRKLARSPITGLPFPNHSAGTIRWLNAVAIDVDCYKVGLSPGDAIGMMVNAEDAGQLPPVNGYIRSGRGVWVFWLLTDPLNPSDGERVVYGATHRRTTSARATAHALRLHARVSAVLAEKLAPLGADLAATDAARMAPFPGTLKENPDGSEERVVWLLSSQRAWTLDALAETLGLVVDPPRPRLLPPAPRDPARKRDATKARAGKLGWAARWNRTLRDFDCLLRLRGGGFAEGARHLGALYLATLLSRAPNEDGTRRTLADIEARLVDYAAHCRPELPVPDVRATLRAARRKLETKELRKRTFPSNARIWASLNVTPAEASYLATTKPPAPRKRRPAAERQEQILALALGRHPLPTTREMARQLRARGFAVSHMTVATDYKLLGLTNLAPRPPQLLD